MADVIESSDGCDAPAATRMEARHEDATSPPRQASDDRDKRLRGSLARFVALSFATALACLPPLPGHAQDSRGLSRVESERLFSENENYAVVVGVDRYEFVPGLSHAVDDARRLATLFEEQGYEVFTLTNYEANPRRILKAVEKAARLATNEGRVRQGNVVFAFSGHGFRDAKANYLATGETEPDELDATALALTDVADTLRRSGVRQRVLFVDACRNVPGAKSVATAGEGFRPDTEAEGVAVFYSTAAERLSWEDSTLGHGVFTHYLAEGLAGAAADADGLVTFDRLQRYVSRAVKRHVVDRFDEVQVPYIGGERTGEFVLARVESDGRSSSVPILPDARDETGRLTVAVQPPDARVRIMNIAPRYRDGMELALGERYDVLVTRAGYQSLRRDVILEDADQVEAMALTRLPARTSAKPLEEPTAAEREARFQATRPTAGRSPSGFWPDYFSRCEDGDATACVALGGQYSSGSRVGRGIEQSHEHSATLYDRACRMDPGEGCTRLGRMYEQGTGFAVDIPEAISLYERGCNGTSGQACMLHGDLHQVGTHATKDAAKAALLYERGCEKEVDFSCAKLGRAYYLGDGVSKDEAEAVSLYRLACGENIGSGRQDACDELRSLLLPLFDELCRTGAAAACTDLGLLYFRGRGVEENQQVAARLYDEGCEGGDPRGCTRLGFMFRTGQGVPKSESKAASLYQRGCDGGHEVGCSNLRTLSSDKDRQ